MKKILNILPLLLLAGCQLITEPDIAGEQILLLAPVDSLVTTNTTHTLWWEHVTNAEKYNVTIVSPSWGNVERLIADTNVSGNKFTVNLPPGKGEYDWGVMAYNHSSSTQYYIRHIEVDTSSDLTNQTVSLIYPIEDAATNIEEVEFKWDNHYAADLYLFDIKIDSWDGERYISQRRIPDNTTTVEMEEGTYYWGVTAQNDFSESNPSVRKLIVDFTPPGDPVIRFPYADYDSVKVSELKIEWERTGSSISAVYDSVYISTDTNFVVGNETQGYPATETELKITREPGKYFTKVRSLDKAGNSSTNYSRTRVFYVKKDDE